jgi:hypothetical protein
MYSRRFHLGSTDSPTAIRQPPPCCWRNSKAISAVALSNPGKTFQYILTDPTRPRANASTPRPRDLTAKSSVVTNKHCVFLLCTEVRAQRSCVATCSSVFLDTLQQIKKSRLATCASNSDLSRAHCSSPRHCMRAPSYSAIAIADA